MYEVKEMQVKIENKTHEIRTTNSSINYTKEHYVTDNALKWEYEKGASISLKLPINTISDNQSKCFSCFVYSEVATEDKFRFAFGFNRETKQYFDYIINFTGYKRINMPYERGFMVGEYTEYLEDFTITYLGDGEGVLYLDKFMFEKRTNPMFIYSAHADQIPNLPKHTKRSIIHQSAESVYDGVKPLFPAPPIITQEEILAFDKIEQCYREMVIDIDTSQFEPHIFPEDVVESFKKYNIVRSGKRVTGKVFESSVDRDFINLMKSIAIIYDKTPNEKYMEMYLDMLYHLKDTAPGRVAWYTGRGVATSLLYMKKHMQNIGVWDEWASYLKDVYHFPKIYKTTSSIGVANAQFEDTDVTGTQLPSLLVCVLLMENTPEKVRDMRCLLQYIEKRCLGFAPGLLTGYKSDGTAFHHCTYIKQYELVPNYTISRVMYMLADTVFALSEEAIKRFKYILTTEFLLYNGCYETFALCQYGYGFTHKKFPGLVEFGRQASVLEFAYTAKATGDKELAQMYLYLAETYSEEMKTPLYKELKSQGFAPMPKMDAHKTLTYVATAIHRRNDFSVMVKGLSKYVFGMEIWAETMDDSSRYSAFALFRNFGFVELLHKPSLDQGVNNGILLDSGFDYRRFSGTTAPIIPLSQLKSTTQVVEDQIGDTTFSDQAFVGGLDCADKNGVFALKLQGPPKYNLQNHYANKTYHFFGDMILCVGSDIRNSSGAPVETILFQDCGTGSTREENIFIDNRGHGYYVFRGQAIEYYTAPVYSCDMMDRYDTSGENTFAVIPHGVYPECESYCYIIKMETSMEQMKQIDFENDFIIKKQDKSAHIVQYQNTVNMVLFEANYEVEDELIGMVTEPCILSVTKTSEKSYTLAICDPDMRFFIDESDNYDVHRNFLDKSVYGRPWIHNESMASKVAILLKTEIENIEFIKGNGSIVQNGCGQSVLEFTCRDGATQEIIITAR